MPESNRLRSAWLAHLLALLGYFLLTLLFTWPLALNLGAAIPGDSFDGWQNYWNQWWIKLALVDRLTSPLFTDILYAPTGVGLYFHTLNPLNGLATLPVQLSAGLIAAYNAAVFFSFVLGGYGMFLLSRAVIGARTQQAAAAAFVAGMIYTLSPFHLAHLLGHMQVISLQWLPFYILYLLRGVAGPQTGTPAPMSGRGRLRSAWVRDGLLAGLFLVANGLSDWYFVLYLLLFTALFLGWRWLAVLLPGLRRGGTAAEKAAFSIRLLWETVRPSLVAAGVFVTLLSPWLWPMIQEARSYAFMVRPPADLYILSASLMDFLVPNRLHSWWRPESFGWIGNQIAPISERTISIGYMALALALAAGVLAWRKSLFWFAAALLFLLLALGPQWNAGNITWEEIPAAVQAGQEIESWTPYALLNQWVPFMRVSRSVSRFALLVQLSIAVLAGVGLHGLLQAVGKQGGRGGAGLKPWRAYALLGVVVLVIGFEYWVAPYPLSPPDTPAYYTQLAAEEDDRAVLNLPMNYDRPGYLLYQTVHRKPLTVAYISRDDPRTLTERVPLLQHFRHLGPDIIDADPALVGPTVLADLGVGTVILDRYKMPGGDERTYTEDLAGRIFAGQTPLFADERLTVYRVQPPPEPLRYLELGPQHWGPLQEGEEGGAWRTISGGPAAVTVRHATGPQRVLLRYRTEQGAGEASAGPALRVLAGGSVLAELPPAADGGEAVIELPAAGDGGDALFVLEAPDDGTGATVRIEQLRLQ